MSEILGTVFMNNKIYPAFLENELCSVLLLTVAMKTHSTAVASSKPTMEHAVIICKNSIFFGNLPECFFEMTQLLW